MNATALLERLREPAMLRTLQLCLTIAISFLAGIAGCIHSWVIPMLRIGGTACTKIAQFQLVIDLGFRYLQTSSRILGGILTGTTYLLYSHPNAATAKLWKHYAVAGGLLITTGLWEEFLIFPTNKRILSMGEDLREEGKEGVHDEQGGRKEELNELLTKWQRWHLGRVLLPLAAAVVTAVALLETP